MSTRCQILVEGHNAIIYRHHDGYPDTPGGVLHVLLPWLKSNANGEHGVDDPPALTAQLLAHLIKEKPNGFFTVEGFDGQFHGDLRYIYIIHKDHVEVLRPSPEFWENPRIRFTAPIKVVDFDGKAYKPED